LFVAGAEANRAIRGGQLDAAHALIDRIRQRLEALPGAASQQTRLGIAYHQLGAVAEHRGDIAAAEGWYRKSMKIKEAVGDRLGLASSYHQLGIAAHNRNDLAAAEGWYRKSMEIEESLGNHPGMAASYHQLGMVAGGIATIWQRPKVGTASHWT